MSETTQDGGKPKTIRWHGDGLYSKTRIGRDGRPLETYFVRAWVPSLKKSQTWKAGHTPAQAERMRRRIMGDPEKAAAARAARNSTIPTCAEMFDRFLATYKSRGQSGYYAQILKAPRAYFGNKRATEISPQSLDGFLRHRRTLITKGVPRKVDGKLIMKGAGRRRVSEGSLRKVCISLGTVCKWAARRGILTSNPLAGIEKPHQGTDRVTRALTHDEERAILTLLPPLERDVVEWAIYSGMRRSEILDLTWPSIDKGRGVVHVIGTKTSKVRVLPLSLSERLPAILSRHPRRIGADLLFHDSEGKRLDVDRVNGIIEAAMKSAGVPKTPGVLWNVFRKTWSSRLYASGKVLPQDEAAWGGHGIAVAMKHYVEYSPAAQERAVGVLDYVSTTGARTGAGDQQTA